MNVLTCGFLIALLALTVDYTRADEVQIQSLTQNGALTWTGPATTGTYRVEWAPTVSGPWLSSWDVLTNLPATGAAVSVAVPMVYRVVYTPAPTPVFSNLTASAAFRLLTNRAGNSNFVILDVRTSGEFTPRHLKGATNLDFYASDFTVQLAALDRKTGYLVYCASGGRSGQTVNQMRTLEFMEVYNLIGGFGSLAALPNAGPWLEP